MAGGFNPGRYGLPGQPVPRLTSPAGVGGTEPVPDAADIEYDNTSSGLTADDVQEAIDELEGLIGTPSLALDDLTDVDAPTPADGDVLTWVDADSEWKAAAPTGGGGTVDIEDEGSPEGAADTIDFVGAGVSVAFAGGTATVTIAGGSGSGNVIAQAAGDVEIPGLAGSADRLPASPDADDDEFDATDTGPITGWTTLGSPTTLDTNTTCLSCLYLKANAAALGLHGIYKNAPTIPFTVTMKVSDYVVMGGNARAQIAVLENTGSGAILSFGFAGNNSRPGEVIGDYWNNRTSYNSTQVSLQTMAGVEYLRMVVASSTSVQCYVGLRGLGWWPLGSTINPSLTNFAVGVVLEGHTSGPAAELFADWIRFT